MNQFESNQSTQQVGDLINTALAESQMLQDMRQMALTTHEAVGTYFTALAVSTGITLSVPFVDGSTHNYQWVREQTISVDKLGIVATHPGYFVNTERPNDKLFVHQLDSLIVHHQDLMDDEQFCTLLALPAESQED